MFNDISNLNITAQNGAFLGMNIFTQNEFFEGYIDDIKISDQKFTDYQVQ